MDEKLGTGYDAVLKEKQHARQKRDLGHRIQVLRVLVRNYYRERRFKMTELDFINHCEAVLDNMLAKYDYDLESIIDKWRTVVPTLTDSPDVCQTCTYRPVFCRCC